MKKNQRREARKSKNGGGRRLKGGLIISYKNAHHHLTPAFWKRKMLGTLMLKAGESDSGGGDFKRVSVWGLGAGKQGLKEMQGKENG